METANETSITIHTTINAPVEKVWRFWTEAKHITNWCFASADWHAPYAENDLRTGGKFKTTMAAKDGSFSFDFGGEYTLIDENKAIEYTIGDGRKVKIVFTPVNEGTEVSETFDAEKMNSAEQQRNGWQAILDNFKEYTEQH